MNTHTKTPLRDQAVALVERCVDLWRDESDTQSTPATPVFYAVDVDVINLYSAPLANAHYAQVFSELQDLNLPLANVLGDYIVRRACDLVHLKNPSVPHALIVLAPHDRELQRVVNAIMRNAAEDVDASQIDPKFGSSLDSVAARWTANPPQSQMEALQSLASIEGLVECLRRPQGPISEMQRLNAIQAGRLLSLSQVHAFKEIPLPPSRIGQDSTFDAIVQRWFDALLVDWQAGGGSGDSDRKHDNLRDDAIVLARLESLNQALTPSGEAAQGRLCLITGAPRLHRVTRLMKSPAHSGFDDFASAYLRHPLAFVGTKRLFEIDNKSSVSDDLAADQEFRATEWLAVCFPRQIIQRQQGEVLHIEWRPDGAEVKRMELPKFAVSNWRDAVVKSDERLRAQQDLENLGAFYKYFKGALANVEGYVGEKLWTRFWQWRVQDEMIQLALTTAPFGLAELLSKPHRRRRGIPALRFDRPDFEDVQRVYEGLSERLFKPETGVYITALQWTRDLEEALRCVEGTDSSGYHKLVMLAYMHACTDNWQQVRYLCRIALLAISNIAVPQPNDKRRGREAAYLLAVAERRLCWPKENGLVHAIKALKQAVERDETREQKDIRFLSEELAQQACELQLKVYRNEGGFRKNSSPPAHDVLRLMPRLLQIAESAQVDNEDHGVRCWVARQCLTNALMLALLCYPSPQHAQIKPLSMRALRLLDSLGLAPQLRGYSVQARRYVDETSDLAWLVATVIYDEDFGRKEAAMLELEQLEERVREQPNVGEHASEVWAARDQYLFDLVIQRTH